MHLSLFSVFDFLIISRLSKDPTSCESVEWKINQRDNFVQDLSSVLLIYELKLEEVVSWTVLELSHEIDWVSQVWTLDQDRVATDLLLHENTVFINSAVLNSHAVVNRDVFVWNLEVVDESHYFTDWQCLNHFKILHASSASNLTDSCN